MTVQGELEIEEPETAATEADVIDALERRYSATAGNGRRYATAYGVRSHAGFDAKRTADSRQRREGNDLMSETRAQGTTAMTLGEFLDAVEAVDAHIDASTGPDYQAQPLARDWARVTKVCEEAGEVWRALSKYTGENPRKGKCGTLDELLGELGDTVSAGLCAIQHLTKDTGQTWEVVSAALDKAVSRISEFPP